MKKHEDQKTANLDQQKKEITDRKPWQDPVLNRRETLPRVTNGFAGSFKP